MDPDDILEPHRPMQHLVNDLRATLSRAWKRDQQLLDGEIAQVLADLFTIHQRRGAGHGQGQPLQEQLAGFCDHIETLTESKPDRGSLAAAPRLDRWCAIIGGDCAQLIGRVTGHPLLRHQARITTSPLLRIAPSEGWARTWSRYYRLGSRDKGFLYELIADGRLPPTAIPLEV